jgi:hypothetical protein
MTAASPVRRRGVPFAILGKQLDAQLGTVSKVTHAVRDMMDDCDWRNPLL